MHIFSYYINIPIDTTVNDAIRIAPSTVILVCNGGKIYISKDCGATFRVIQSPTEANLNQIDDWGSLIVVPADNGAVIESSDEGLTCKQNPLLQLSRTSARSTGSITTKNLYRVAFGNNTEVIAGANGTIITSSNGGATWTLSTSPTSSDIISIAFGNNTFVAVDDNGYVLTSTDNGASWTKQSSWLPFNSIVFGNDIFVGAGYAGLVATSTNGAAWTERTSGTTDTLSGIAFGNNGFVAVGGNFSGLVLTSSDGITWTNR